MIRPLAVSVCLVLAACQTAPSRFEFTELHMGMPVTMVLYTADTVTARAAARAGFQRIAELEEVFSDYRAGSEVRQLARRAEEEPGAWIPVSRELHGVIVLAREVASLTDGVFDPTLGPLTTLWRESRASGRLPDQRTLDSARALTGWARLQVDTAAGAVRFTMPGMRLDLGGIAKGFILGAARRALERAGVSRALIEAGGDIVVGATPPGRKGWEVKIAGRLSEPLTWTAVATSGTDEQFVEIDGVRYAHLIETRGGLGVARSRTVTVVGPDAALADALATALVVMDESAVERLRARFPGYRIYE